MRLFNPAEAGGTEPSFAEMIETWIAMARLDGSFGWIGIANLPSSAAAAAYLPDAGFDEVFAANDGRVTMGGQFFPNGTGDAVDGGYRLTGAWNFGSGTGHGEYVAAGFMPMVDGDLVWVDRGRPRAPRGDPPPRRDHLHRRLARAGPQGHRLLRLRGRGRLRARAPHVPALHPRAAPGLVAGVPHGPHARSPPPATPAGRSASPRACSTTSRSWPRPRSAWATRRPSPTSPSFQRGLAHHLAMWRAARLLVHDTFATGEAAVGAGERAHPDACAPTCASPRCTPPTARARSPSGPTSPPGTTAIREGSRLERAFRDLYTGTQHAFISEKVAIDAAQVWLGIQPDPIGL